MTQPVYGVVRAWAYHRKDPSRVIPRIENDLLTDVTVLNFDPRCARDSGGSGSATPAGHSREPS